MDSPKKSFLGFVQVDLLLCGRYFAVCPTILSKSFFRVGSVAQVSSWKPQFPPQKNVKIHPMISLPNLTPKNQFCSTPCVYLLFGAPNLIVIIDAIHRFILPI